jgi:hypothetical protein
MSQWTNRTRMSPFAFRCAVSLPVRAARRESHFECHAADHAFRVQRLVPLIQIVDCADNIILAKDQVQRTVSNATQLALFVFHTPAQAVALFLGEQFRLGSRSRHCYAIM